MLTSTNLRRRTPPASARTVLRTAIVLTAAALLALAGLRALNGPAAQVDFLQEALGAPASEASLVRTPAAGTTVRLVQGGYRVETDGTRVGLRSADSGAGGKLTRFADGVSRRTPFGWETTTVTPSKVEQYLTVAERQGSKTWRWQLDTSLDPKLSLDGAVTFRSKSRPAAVRIRPVAILDGDGRDITPADARWSLAKRSGGWTLALRLDDSELPLPYVIDPAADYGPQLLYPTRTQSTVLGGGTTNATPGQVYGMSTAAPSALCTLATNNSNTCPAVRDNTNTNGTFYSQVWNTSGTAPSTGSWLAAPQVPATGATALGGFLVNAAGTSAPTAIPAGNWTFEMWTDASTTSGTVNANLTVGAWIVTTSGTGATATIASVDTTVINPTSAAATLATNLVTTTATTKRTLTVPGVAKTTLTANQRLYVRFYIKKITTANQRLNGYIHLLVNGTNGTVTTPSSILHPTAVETPGAPAPTLPADNGWVITANPTFSATYATTGTNTGRLNVDLCPDAGCGTQLETLNSTSSVLANGGAGTTPATSTTLTNGTYYRWRAAGEVVTAANPSGPTGVVSSWSAVRRFGVDLTNPTGSVTAPVASANVRGAAVAVTSNSADAFSGVASVQFQRSPAGAGTWTAIGAADIVAPYSVAWDTTALSDGLYDLRAVTTDNAARTNTSAVVTNVRVDNTAPTQSLALTSLAPAGSAYLAGTNVFYRGTGGGSGGNYKVRNTVTDGGSGPASSTTGALGGTATGWSHAPGTVSTPAGGPYDSAQLTWVEGTSSSPTVALSAADAVGNPTASSITLTLKDDSVAPSGGLLRVNGIDATGGVSTSDSGGSFGVDLRGDWAETPSGTASGLSSSILTRDVAPYANGSCGTYSGSPTTLIGAPAQVLPAGCYRYVLTGVDNVGNSVAVTTDVRVHGAPSQIDLTGSAADLASGTSRLVTATIEDAAGNAAVTDSSTVVTFAQQSGTGTVTGLGSASATAGVATKTVTGGLASALVLEASSGALTADTLSFTVVHGTAAAIQLAQSGSNLSGDAHTLTATIRDADGNTVTGDNSTVVAFTKVSGLGTVSGLGSATASNGVATKALTNVLAGSIGLEATASGLTTGSTSYTIVHGAGTQVALSESGSTTSGGNHTLTATIRDAAGNTVTNDNTTLLAFSKASGLGTVSGLGSVTATAGIANKTVTNETAGAIDLEGTAAGLTTGTASYTIAHGAAVRVALTESGSTASGDPHLLTATIQDAAGNTVTADSSTVVTFVQTGGAGTVTGLGNATAANGVATKSVTNSLAGSVDLVATAAGFADGTASYAVVHGAAAQIQLAATGSSTSGATKTLTATLRDAAGNTVTGDNSTVVAFSKTGGAGTVTGLGTATAAGGVATKLVTNALAGTIDLEATAAGLAPGSDSFTIVPGAASALELVESGSTASGDAHTLTATVVDAAGNTVTDDDSTVVTFGKTSGSGTVTGLDSVIATDGVAIDTVTNVLAGAIGLDAQTPGLTAGSTSYPIVHGAAAEIELTHDGMTTSGASNDLTATIRDAAGNTVTSDSSTVVGFAQASGSGTVGGLGAATASAGVASRSVTNVLAGSVGLEASAPGLAAGSTSYTVAHGAAAKLALTHSGSTLSGDDHTLTATVQDAAGNTIASDSSTVVTFAQNGGAGSVTGLGTATASSGVATKTVTNAATGTIDLNAQAGGLTPGSASYSISPGAASTATSTISALPLSIVADGVTTSTITVQLKDAVGNDAAGSGGIVALLRSGSGSLSAVTDNGDGTYTATLTSPTSVGGAAISGTLNGAALADSESVTFTHGPATQIVLAQSGTAVSGDTQTLTATVRDANGNDVTSDSSTVVTFAKTGGAGTVTGLGAATASNGVATSPVTNSLAGGIDLQASAMGLTAGTTSYTIVHGAAAGIELAESGSAASGGTHTLTATLRDAAGNTVVADGSTVVTFEKTGGAGTVTGLGGATASSGIATLAVANVLAGPIDLSASSGGLTPGTASYTVVHGPAAAIELTESGSTLSGDDHTLTATIEDAAGNTVTGDSSTVVTFAQTSGAGSVTGLGAATVSNGVAIDTVTNELVGSVGLSATATGLADGSASYAVVHGAAAQIELVASGSSVSGADKTLTATIRDAAGNAVTSDSSTVVTFGLTSGPGSVSGLGTATASGGVAILDVTNDLAGAIALEATAPGLSTGTAGYTISAGTTSTSTSTIVAAPGSLVADGVASSTITVQLRDAVGNDLGGSGGLVELARTGTGTLGPVTDNGDGSYTATLTAPTTVGSTTITGTLNAAALAASASVTYAHGPATKILLTDTGFTASGDNHTLTATIQDAHGNTVTSDSSTLVAFTKASGAGTVTGLGSVTAAAGVASTTVTNETAGQIDLEATAAGLTTGTTNYTIAHGAAAGIELTESGSTASGDTHTLTATIQDAAGNPVTGDSTTVVSFAQSGGGGSVTGLGTASAANGIATKPVTNTLAGSVDLAATAAGLADGTASYTVLHGAATQIQLTATGSSTSGADKTLTATIQDAAGNTVTGDSSTVVTFAQTGGAGSVTGLGTATATAGVATKTVTNTLAGSVDLDATAIGLAGGTATYTVLHGAAAQLELAVSGSSVSGADKTLTATIRDAAGNTVTADSSTVVTFGLTSGPGGVSGLGTATASNGVANKTVTNTLAGPIVLEATAGALASGSAGYTIVHGAATQIDLALSGSSLSGSGKTLTAIVRDAAGNTLTSDSSSVVTFAQTGGTGTVTGLGTATAAAGVATKVITNVLAGTIELEAAAGGLFTGTASYTVVHGGATQIDLAVSGSDASGGTKSLTATIQDAAGNTVVSDSATLVTFAKTGGSGTVTGLGTDTAAGGLASLDVTNALAGQVDLEATAAGLASDTASWTISAGSASTTTSTIDAAPGTIVADGVTTSTITVQLRDAVGNELAASAGVVALSLSGTGSLGSVTDGSDGTYTASLTSPTTVGSGSITGTLNAVALADSTAVTYEHGPAAAIVLTDSGSTVAGDTHTLTATIVDAHGNTVTSDSSTVVSFAKANGTGTVVGLGTATALNGVALATVTNALAGPISLEATAGGLAAGTTGYTTVVGTINAATSTVAAAPTSVQNNGTDTSTITVTVRDAGGNPLPGATVTLDDDGADSAISPPNATTNGAGIATFAATSTTVETAVYTATADAIELTDTAGVSFVYSDTNDPINTITLATATGAFLSGTDLFYRPLAAGSVRLSSAVVDAGSGPASATYPAVGQTGWTHSLETVTVPAAGPYVSNPFSWTAAATGDFSIVVTAADSWAPANTSDTTIDVIEDSSSPAGQTIALGGGPTYAALSVPFVLGDGSDLGSGLDTASRTVTRESALFTNGACGAFTSDLGQYTSPDTTVQSGRCYRYSITIADRVGNVSTAVTSAAAQVDTVAPPAPVQTVTETGDDGHAAGSILYYDPAGSGTFTVTSTVSDGESGIDKVSFPAPAAGFASLDPADASTPPYARSYSWSAGAAGSGMQTVTALDVAGNSSAGSFTLTPDAADPTVSFDGPAGGAMLDSGPHALEATAGDAGAGVASVLFEFSSTGAGGPFTVIDTVDTSAPYAVSWDTSSVSDGPKVLRATVTDDVGHTAEATRNVFVDAVPGAPVTSITSQPADPSANTTPAFGFGSSETTSTFECRLDSGGWSACPSPFTVAPALGDGSHTLEVRASDAAGNQDATPESYTWVVDATAPTGALTAPAALAAVSGTAVLVTSSSTDGGTGVQHALFEVLVEGVWQALGAPDTSAPYSATWVTTGLADGDHDLRVTTRDNAGNSTVSPVRTVTVDNSLPLLSASVSHNPVNLTTPDPALVSAVADDLGSGIANVLFEQCNETSPACTSDTWTTLVGPDTVAPFEVDWALPSDGTRLLRVTATDNAGRSAVELILTTVDRTRPSGSVTAPAAGTDLRGSVALVASASDTAPGSVNTVTFQVSPAGAGVWADVDSDGSAPYGASLDTTGLTDGLYDLRVFTTDAAGNAETAPAETPVRVDNTAPTTTDDAPASWRNGDVAVTLAVGDPGGSGVTLTEYRIDGASAQPYAGPLTVSGEGVHTLEYRSQDAAGNWENWQTTSVRIDETGPVTTDDAPAAWQPGATTVTLSPTDAGGSGLATTTFELDGGATQTGATVNVPATHGTHTITYRSTDAAGNVEVDRTATVRIDRLAPTTGDDAPAGLGNLPVTVALTATDPDAGVATTTYEVNGGASQTGASVSIPAVTGTYTITYRSTDTVGNVEPNLTATVQIDATAPTTSAAISPRNPNNGPITVSLSGADAGGAGVDETRFRIDGGAETVGSSALVAGADGPHTVHFYSVDTLGNVEAEQLVTVTIDTAGPTGTPGNPGGYLRGAAAELRWTPDTPADVSSVTFEFSTAGAGAWAALPGGTIGTPMLAAYTYSWNTTAVADGEYDLRVRVEDELGNETIQLLPGLPKTVDNGLPTATVSTPAGGTFVSASVALGGSANDALSGISSTAIQLKPDGAAGFTTVASSASGIVSTTWDSSSVADGPVEIKVVATDGAGNQAESAVVTFTVDNDAPTVALADPGAAVNASPTLTATAAVDTANVAFEYRAAGTTPWLPIDTDATPGDGFSVTWSNAPVSDGTYELRARATDGGGNTGTSGIRTVVLDKTNPTGSVTAPAGGSTVGGPAVALAATAADTGSGVRDVVFLVKQFGSSSFDPVGTDATAPYAVTWDASGATDGAAELRVLVTDIAGNTRNSSVVPVTVDSSGPSVTLTDPGVVLSGTVALGATTGGSATRVLFELSLAGAGSWTEIATDTTAPFGTALDTTALADGVYDVRATGFDALDNPSTPSVRAGVRFDNTAPSLLSSTPADGSVSTSANQIELTASEPVTAPGALLDGGPAPAPVVAGSTLTFATGALADGLHVLSGELEDASGTRTPFRVAVTIESTPSADPPPVERSITSSGSWTMTVPGGLVTVKMQQSAWPTPPTPQDYILVLRVDAGPGIAAGAGFAPGTQIVEVTARWAIAGTYVTEFNAPIEIIFSNPTGVPAVPAWSSTGTSAWNTMGALGGSNLPAGARDGFYHDTDGVHVLTRHLTFFGLMLDDEAPTPPIHIAGVVADDGLTIRWIPGTDSSGRIGNVILVVNDEEYRHFGPTEYEAKLGAIEPGDTRRFQLLQLDAAGNKSVLTPALRAVPSVVGLGVDAARAALAERGFAVGSVQEQIVPTVAAGTVVGPVTMQMAVETTAIDLVVARGTAAGQTKFVLQVASAKTLKVAKRTTIAARVKVTRPAQLTATLYSPAKRRLFTWHRTVQAGSNIVQLRLPLHVRRPGAYRVVWVARSGAETIRRTIRFQLVAPTLQQPASRPKKVEVVLAGELSAMTALTARLAGTKARVVARTDSDGTFALAASPARNVSVVVVDVDVLGVEFVRDLDIVFPDVRLIGIASDATVLARAVRAGAVLGLPRSTPAAKIAKAVVRVASGR